MFKMGLALCFTFRENDGVKYSLNGACVILMVYKIFVRIKRSYMFNQLTFNSAMLFDSTILHFLYMTLISGIFHNDFFYISVLLTLPIFLLFTFFLVARFETHAALTTLDLTSRTSDMSRLHAFLQILDFYYTNSTTTSNSLRQIWYSHNLHCETHAIENEKRLWKRSKHIMRLREEIKTKGVTEESEA